MLPPALCVRGHCARLVAPTAQAAPTDSRGRRLRGVDARRGLSGPPQLAATLAAALRPRLRKSKRDAVSQLSVNSCEIL